MVATLVSEAVVCPELVILALGAGSMSGFWGHRGAFMHQGGHRPFLPCRGLPFYPDSIASSPKKKKKGKAKGKTKGTGGLGTSRGIETMFRTSYRVNMDLSALADTKSNIMISINGLIISIILGTIASKIDANPWLIIPTSVLLIGCLASMVYAVLATRPRISSRVITLDDVRQNKANILFFGNYIYLSRDDYIVGMKELMQNTNQLYHNMIVDIYGLGHVLQKKFKLLRVSYTIFMISLIVGVTMFILVFVWVVLFATP